MSPTVDQKEFLMVLPYHGKLSENLRVQLVRLFNKAYPQINLHLVFRTTFRIMNMFNFKDVIPKRLNSHVVYGINCNVCNSSYGCKTKRHLETRFKEHLNIHLPTAVTEHMMASNHQFRFEDVKILERGKTDIELLIKESLTYKKQNLIFNNYFHFIPNGTVLICK